MNVEQNTVQNLTLDIFLFYFVPKALESLDIAHILANRKAPVPMTAR